MKDAKIAQLQKNLVVRSEVGRLQQQVQQLYQEREAELGERMRDVSRRARTPSAAGMGKAQVATTIRRSDWAAGVAETGGGATAAAAATEEALAPDDGQPESLDSWGAASMTTMASASSAGLERQRPYSVAEAVPPVLRPLPNPTSTRSKVFRHKLQKTLLMQSAAVESPTSNANCYSFEATADPSVGATAAERNGSAVTVRTPSLISLRQHRKSLPHDYKAVVATLPPIAGGFDSAGSGGSAAATAQRRTSVSKKVREEEEEGPVSTEAEVHESPVLSTSAGSSGGGGGDRPACTESFA